MKIQFPIEDLCETLEVSSSGFYAWQKRAHQPSARIRNDIDLQIRIQTIHRESRNTYGSPRIHRELRALGHRHGRKRVARLMRTQGLQARSRRRFRPRTTDSRHNQPIAPNRLPELGPPTAINRVWVTDITYVPTTEGWLFLAVVMDLYSRRIVGWAFSPSLAATLAVGALRMALQHRQPAPGLVLHSDRGVQFASAEFRGVLQHNQLLASMSRKACCYDNAAMEAFFSTLKLELIYPSSLGSAQQTAQSVFDYLESFYNRRRRHSRLQFESPAQFENSCNGVAS